MFAYDGGKIAEILSSIFLFERPSHLVDILIADKCFKNGRSVSAQLPVRTYLRDQESFRGKSHNIIPF
jgi:hypothetical protein